MCGGFEVKIDGKPVRVYFPSPKATIPIERAGQQLWLPWGRRREEAGRLPPGGWAREDSLLAGKWKRFHPVEVVARIEGFMEKDQAKTSHWFAVQEELMLRCLIATADGEQRAYVITGTPPVEHVSIHDRWPLFAIRGGSTAAQTI